MASGLFDSGLAFNSGLVTLFFDEYEVEDWMRRDLLKKVMVYVAEYKAYTVKEIEKERQKQRAKNA